VTAAPGPTDAELVAGVLTADRDAFAAVYDRYGSKLYDFAYSMLRHPEDAADAVADSFVMVAERLRQLRDPERLRPWLYAIVRSECLRKLRARKRVAYGGEEQLSQMADDALTPDQEAEQAAMQKIVWDAAAGLADRDRALLDLHLRQGLEGAELGEAMGVSASNAYVMLNRLRGQVDRSLGALLIARLGRDDCDDLEDLLADWDGTFSPLVRKRVSRHVDDCDVCSKRRKKIVSPWMLLASVPVFTAPLALRQRVVDDTQLVAYTLPDGQPITGASDLAPRRRPKASIAAAAAAVVIIVTGATALLWPGNDGDPSPAADPIASATSSALPTKPVVKPSASDSATPTATPAPGSLTLSAESISLGRSGSNSSVTLTNSGGLAISYRLTTTSGWLSPAPNTGRLDAGASSRIAIHADRGEVGEGVATGSVVISWDAGRSAVKVSLDEENGPTVGRPTATASSSCTHNPVRVSASDPSGLRSVILRWSGAGSGSVSMSRSGSHWAGDMGQFAVGGHVTMSVAATDKRGNTTTGPAVRITVNPCPG
jgi:RNA polymerase sigma factor (sigma-70 family)